MRPYEVMVILGTALEESAVQAQINRSSELVTSRGGRVNRVEKWGRRRLAYEINHQAEGYYVLMEVTSDVPPMDDLDRSFRLADEVIRHKIVRMPDGPAGRTLPASALSQISMSGPRDRDN